MPSIKKSQLILAALVIGSASTAYAGYYDPEVIEPAQSHTWYVNFNGGVSIVPTTRLSGIASEYRTSWNTGFAAGLQYRSFRFELEYRYQPVNLNRVNGVSATGRQRVNSALVNALYDFGTAGDTYRPYFGGGLGYARVKYPQRVASNEFAYQAIFGIGFTVNDYANFTLDYRYFGTSTAGSALGDRYQNHMINAGIVYFLD